MKRWLVVLLVLLALLVLLSPGIIGRLAEKNIEANIEWAEQDSPGVNIETESYERGWFTSAGRHRIVFDEGRFRAVAEDYRSATGNDQLPSLIVDTTLEHGPLPGGSLSPGLANTVSMFTLDPGDGAPVPIKGALRSRVGLDGASESQLMLEPDTFSRDDATFSWQGADFDIASDPATSQIRVG
ncbi:MAG: YdgA family protein, partial [Gammaproteobacteria bacterium]|nr:YdgA family protein [Gammaproteobacteria bacterium]